MWPWFSTMDWILQETRDFYTVPDVPDITLKFQQLTGDSGIYQCSLTSFLSKHFLISKKVMQTCACDVSVQPTLSLFPRWSFPMWCFNTTAKFSISNLQMLLLWCTKTKIGLSFWCGQITKLVTCYKAKAIDIPVVFSSY